MSYHNPILPGFHPDPSICRVGEDYYLVTSSFEYFPGLPIFHSRDLVHWRQLGHCLTRPGQLPLTGARASGGIFAPTLRHHKGRFYVVTKNTTARQMMCVHAGNPAGDWSDPVWLGEWGGDPSLLFDDDGLVYLTVSGEDAIHQTTINPQTGAYDAPLREIWRGTGCAWPEGPHLYHINGSYYLMVAEGGTRYGHQATITRSPTPWGPFTPCPWNPILTQRSTSSPIQAAGHADLVQDHRGNWWLVCLAIRPIRDCHHLGRETFLAPVVWEDGWPRVGYCGRLEPTMDGLMLPPHPWPPPPVRDDFDDPAPQSFWNFLRLPQSRDWSLDARPGWLRLNASGVTLDDEQSPAFLGRRQQHFDFQAATKLEFMPAPGQEAGLTVRMNERHHCEIAVTRRRGKRRVITRCRLGSVTAEHLGPVIPEGPVHLLLRGDCERYLFSVAPPDAPPLELAQIDCRFLSSEVAGGYTGVYLGLYAVNRGRHAATPADFDYFDYKLVV